jgi:hypothetical protein
MLAHVAGEHARIGVVAAAGAARDQHGDRLAFVEFLGRLREAVQRQRKESAGEQRHTSGAREYDSA